MSRNSLLLFTAGTLARGSRTPGATGGESSSDSGPSTTTAEALADRGLRQVEPFNGERHAQATPRT